MNKIPLNKYFQLSEFACPCCHTVMIADGIVQKLYALRNYIKKPVIINSAYRCPAHNAAVGGNNNSQHLKGAAVDITIAGLRPDFVANIASLIGFKRVYFVLGRHFTHCGL